MDAQTLYRLIITENSSAAMAEVRDLLPAIAADFPVGTVERDFWTAARLYGGELPGFRACNTEYHNFFHARQTFLITARLLHGAACEGVRYPLPAASLVLTAAIFHDAGYLQEEGDLEGTGAKYTRSHVTRGIALLHRLRECFGYGKDELAVLEAMLLSTDLALDYTQIVYPSAEAAYLSQLLDAADLLAQMSDRTYLEKLLLLYHEFREAGICDYASEGDLLRKSVIFYQKVEKRLQPIGDDVDRYLRAHFRRRHGFDLNPYRESMARQRDYLLDILKIAEEKPEEFLRRGGIVDKVRTLHPS